jgi:Isoprenylcysteine carboxyl methyltransferase (ICMT) family.
LAILSALLKGFYGPLMVKSLMVFCMGAWGNGRGLLHVGLGNASLLSIFDRFGYFFLMQAILFVDVFFFTVGYLVESPRLRNEIRSVDPTLLGWTAALMCYPPFNFLTAHVLGTQRSDFPQFDDPTVHMALNLLLLTLMGIYASASAALGLKASNLTHRGIVARGPYAIIRHPAYTCKNMAWWIGALPVIGAAFRTSLTAGLVSAASVVAWTSLYLLRALTEEDHLRKVDGEYAAYAAKVKYRFIPGVV